MIVYITYKPIKLEDQLDVIASSGSSNIQNKWYWLRAIDFGDGLLDMKTQDYNNNQERIHRFLSEDFWKILKRIEYQNVMELYDEDDEMRENIIVIDTEEEKIHVGYLDEYWLE